MKALCDFAKNAEWCDEHSVSHLMFVMCNLIIASCYGSARAARVGVPAHDKK